MIRLFKLVIITILLLSFLLLTACTTPGIGNNFPYITSLTANPDSIGANQTTTLTCNAYDSDGDSLIYTWSEGSGTTTEEDDEDDEEDEEEDIPPEDERNISPAFKAAGTITGSGKTVTWKAPGSAGTYTVTCTVSDGRGGEDSEMVSIIVTIETLPPDINPPILYTYSAFDIRQTEAKIKCGISGTGGEWANMRGVEYRDVTAGGSTQSTGSSGSFGVGKWYSQLSNLTPDHQYQVRAYATNSEGTGYGQWITFNTLP